MSAAEPIRAAITKLEQLRDAASAGGWTVHAPWPGSFPTGIIDARSGEVADALDPADSDLIVTLHRTIDTQLAILRAGIAAHSPGDDTTEEIEVLALDLAHAILGEDTE